MLTGRGTPHWISILGVTLVVAGVASMVAPAPVDAKTGAVGTQHSGTGNARKLISPRTSSITWTPVGPVRIPNAHVGDASEASLIASGRIQAFTMDPGNPQLMYAGGGVGTGNSGPASQAGFLRSTDGGTTWSRSMTGLTDPMIDALWLDPGNPNVILASTFFSGIFRSTDGGSSWSQVWQGSATSIVSSGTTLYAGVEQGIVSSTNDGVSWSILDSTPSAVRTVSAGPGSIWAGLDNGAVIARTSPNGSWQTAIAAPSCGQTWDVAADPSDANTAVVAQQPCGAGDVNLVTHDGGVTWSTWSSPPSGGYANSGGPAKVLLFDPENSNVIYSGSGGGLYVSTNGGSTWSFVHLMEDLNMIQVFVAGSTEYLVVGGDQGIYESTNQGSSWTSLNGNAYTGLQTGVAVSGSEILTPVQDFSPEQSFDGGNTWEQLSSSGAPSCEDGVAAIDPLSSSFQYVWNGCGFQYSTDGGQSFTKSPSLPGSEWTFNGDEDYLSFDMSVPGKLYAVAKDGIFISTDHGADWQNTNWGFANPSLVVVDPTNDQTIFVGMLPVGGCCSTPGTLEVSHNGGSTWSQASIAGIYGNLTALSVDPANPSTIYLGTSLDFAQGGGIFESTDGGSTFHAVNSGLNDSYPADLGYGYVIDLAFSPDSSTIVAGTADGIYASTPSRSSWANVSGNAVPNVFDDVAFSGSTVYASTYGEGIVSIPLSAVESAAASAPPPLSITTTSLGGGTQGIPYSATLSASGGTTPYAWSLASGSLPSGLTLSPGGTISGTPTVAGTSNFTVSVSDSSSPTQTATQVESITVTQKPPPTPTLTAVSPSSGPIAGGTTVTITGTNLTGAAAVDFGPTAATNLSCTSTQCSVTSPAGAAGIVDVTVTTSGGTSAKTSADQFTYSSGSSPVSITTTSLPPATVGTAYSTTLSSSGGTPPYSWSVTSGSLPTGLSLSASGTITGTPTAGYSGACNPLLSGFTVTVADSSSPAGSASLQLCLQVSNKLASVSGYWMLDWNGSVYPFGSAKSYGDPASGFAYEPPPALPPYIAIAPTPDGGGYWILSCTKGGCPVVDNYGDAGSFTLSTPTGFSSPVAIAATPDGKGYWVATADGQVLTAGDAQSYGSPFEQGLSLNKGIVSMAITPDGKGYWLLGGDGGVFTYGDATFFGSTGNIHLNAPAVGMASTSDGNGYWFVATDGGVFTYGDASFLGSMGGTPLAKPVNGMVVTPDGGGYWLVASDGGVFTFGDAGFVGSCPAAGSGCQNLSAPIVGFAAS